MTLFHFLKKGGSSQFRSWLEVNKIFFEITALVVAISAVCLPWYASQKANELTSKSLEFISENQKLALIPFVSFDVSNANFATDTVNFLTMVLENNSDVPAMSLKVHTSSSGKEHIDNNGNYADLLPHQKKFFSLTLDTSEKEKIFSGQSKLDVDIETTDLLSNVYHLKRRIFFQNGQWIQGDSFFKCDQEKSKQCPDSLK